MEYMTMAEAVGEAPARPLTFIPGEDYDPYDEDDVAAVGLAMDLDRADRVRELEDRIADLERENARLRAEIVEQAPPF
jgi:uncharacterized small protein (DUF1192 family)